MALTAVAPSRLQVIEPFGVSGPPPPIKELLLVPVLPDHRRSNQGDAALQPAHGPELPRDLTRLRRALGVLLTRRLQRAAATGAPRPVTLSHGDLVRLPWPSNLSPLAPPPLSWAGSWSASGTSMLPSPSEPALEVRVEFVLAANRLAAPPEQSLLLLVESADVVARLLDRTVLASDAGAATDAPSAAAPRTLVLTDVIDSAMDGGDLTAWGDTRWWPVPMCSGRGADDATLAAAAEVTATGDANALWRRRRDGESSDSFSSDSDAAEADIYGASEGLGGTDDDDDDDGDSDDDSADDSDGIDDDSDDDALPVQTSAPPPSTNASLELALLALIGPDALPPLVANRCLAGANGPGTPTLVRLCGSNHRARVACAAHSL